MSTTPPTPPTPYSAALIAELRETDRATWPSVDRVLARTGFTRAEALAGPLVAREGVAPAPAPAPSATTPEAA